MQKPIHFHLRERIIGCTKPLLAIFFLSFSTFVDAVPIYLKMRVLYIINVLYFILGMQTPIYCQNFWNNTFLTGGIALSEQDRRLFEFPLQDIILEREDDKFDYEYNITLQKRVARLGRMETRAGIGYAAFTNTFSRPFDHSVINGGNDLFLRFLKRYTINKLVFPVSNNFYLTRNQAVFLNFNILSAISFRKTVKHHTARYTKWELELNSLELYPGLGVKLNPRMQLAAHYRWVYIYKLDEVIFNHLLFYERDPEFLQKEYDNYNPLKIWVTASYALGN